MKEFQFTKGMEVEVFSDDKDLRGVLFVATVRSVSMKKKKVLIEYQTLMADEIGSKPLREFVNVVQIRPIPPREVDRVFRFSDEVDAYHNDGWWEGVVVKVLEDCRYLVYFRSGKEEIEFGRSELRIHREWVRGVWVPPMEVAVVDLTKNEEKQDLGLKQSQDDICSTTNSASGSNTTSQKLELLFTKCSTPPSNKLKTGESSLFRIPRPRTHSIVDDFSLSPLPSINGECSQINKVQSCKKLKKGEETESSCFLVPNSTTLRNFSPENLRCST